MTQTGPTYYDASTADVRLVFEHALLCALTEGRLPGLSSVLGVNTWAAIEAIARDHPEAAAELINEADDSYHRDAAQWARDTRARLAPHGRLARAAGGRRHPSPADDDGTCLADHYDDELDTVASALNALDDRPSE